jgi:transcription-repair coupling factor (superfamily II helicase)
MRDLEIRGAGNILGSEQSGHVHAVGFELYSQILNEAVAEIKADQGDPTPVEDLPQSPARVSLSLSAHIPESYIAHLPTRLAIYQRLAKVQGRPEIEDIGEELRDRFGALPQGVDNLLYLVSLKLLAGEAGIESITQSGTTVTLTLLEAVGGARIALEKALGPLTRVGNQQVHINMRRAGDLWKESLVRVLERLLAFRKQLQTVSAPPVPF